MRRNQTFHEILIPLLVEGLGCQSYLELGTHHNETIGKVTCPRRFGVDTSVVPCAGAMMFRMTTAEFIYTKARELGPFDFVFIDADHSLDAVRRDLHGIWPFVQSEGIVCLHDTNPETAADTAPGLCGDSWKITREIPSLERITLPYHPGLTLIRKRTTWGPS